MANQLMGHDLVAALDSIIWRLYGATNLKFADAAFLHLEQRMICEENGFCDVAQLTRT
jgi:hypothetical protein